jgi:hypothetical protein
MCKCHVSPNQSDRDTGKSPLTALVSERWVEDDLQDSIEILQMAQGEKVTTPANGMGGGDVTTWKNRGPGAVKMVKVVASGRRFRAISTAMMPPKDISMRTKRCVESMAAERRCAQPAIEWPL